MYSAMYVAQYIITKCTADLKPVSNLQLQKILYYIQKVIFNLAERHFLMILKPGRLDR